MQLTAEDIAELTRLEEAMWIASSRYDPAFQEQHFAGDFFEFGRSGRSYSREQCLVSERPPGPIAAQLPLDNLVLQRIDTHTALLTYNSHVAQGAGVQHARRSSLWSQVTGTWVMRFHQGTPYEP